MKNDIEKNQRDFMNYWPPRISAILFVVFMYMLIMSDFLATMSYHPVLYNFFIGTIILAMTLVIWKKEHKLNGVYFILIGVIYLILMWNKLLVTSVISTSVWLVLTGILFFLAPKIQLGKQKTKKLKIGE